MAEGAFYHPKPRPTQFLTRLLRRTSCRSRWPPELAVLHARPHRRPWPRRPEPPSSPHPRTCGPCRRAVLASLRPIEEQAEVPMRLRRQSLLQTSRFHFSWSLAFSGAVRVATPPEVAGVKLSDRRTGLPSGQLPTRSGKSRYISAATSARSSSVKR